MAHKYVKKFGTVEHSLKIGKSFEKKNDAAYHSIRYDFKPGSIDESKEGSLEVEENSSVAVTLPHTDGFGSTIYKGSAKPANSKDCILIIDWETGELRLERVSNQILLKKTREKNPGSYCDSMNNDVKEFMMSSSTEKIKQETESSIKIEHDSEHFTVKEALVKKETDIKQQQIQNQNKMQDSIQNELKKKQQSLVEPEDRSISVPLNESFGLGLGLSDSSDDSDSDSSTGSESDSSAPSSTIMRQGQLPTARPMKLHKARPDQIPKKLELKVVPHLQSSMPNVLSEFSSFEQEVKKSPSDIISTPVISKPSSGVSSMPNFGFDKSPQEQNEITPEANSSVPVIPIAATASVSAGSIRSSGLGEDLELSDSDSD